MRELGIDDWMLGMHSHAGAWERELKSLLYLLTSNQQPATSNEKPVTRNQQQATKKEDLK
jgi:hypothetical protein